MQVDVSPTTKQMQKCRKDSVQIGFDAKICDVHLYLIGLILFSMFMTTQIRDVVCQKQNFANGARRESRPSSREEL